MTRLDARFLEEIRARTPLVALIGRTVALKRAGADWKGLCPFHRERHASFYVVERKRFYYCFGCGARGDAVKWVMETTTARDFREAVAWLAAQCGLSDDHPVLARKPMVRRPGAAALAAEKKRKIAQAEKIWRATRPLAGTAAERYLRGARHIRMPLPSALRFHPALPHPFLPARQAGLPALVAGIQGADGAFAGAHCTYLAADGGKAPPPTGWPAHEEWKPKIMRGAFWGGAVRLTVAEPVMVLAEGIETGLAVLQSLWDPEAGAPHLDGACVAVWACLNLGNMGGVVLPDGVREVVIAADSDATIPVQDRQRGPEEILETIAEKHVARGRAVRIARPPAGSDFNDLLPAGVGYEPADEAA